MRALDPLFEAHLASGVTTLATCWRIARADGAVFAFTDHDRALVLGGETFEPDTGADGAALAARADFSVGNTEIDGLLSSERLDAAELQSGRFDGADIEIWRVNWQAPDQRLLVMRGTIGEVRREGARFTAEIRGPAAALDETRGRLYQRHCDARLGDARCGVDLDAPALRGEGTVTAIVDEARFSVSGLSLFADAWFDMGALEWTGGANSGTRSHVKSYGSGSIALFAPPGAAVAPGDLFVVRAGCDKSFATCAGKFANALNFRGFHLMPGDDVVLAPPFASGRNDGSRR